VKTTIRCALLLAMTLLPTISARADTAPAISAKQALQLAEEALAPKNTGGGVYVSSISLQPTAVLGGKRVWTVMWSESVEGSRPGTKELGLEIHMDGAVVHLIKGRGNTKPQPSPH
jgi:hypothetical protein